VARIVVGVDGSEASIVALQWAVAEGRRWGASVEAARAWSYPVGEMGVYAPAVEPDVLEESAAAGLEEALRTAFPEDPDRGGVERVILTGTPAQALTEQAKGADLLVVGSRGRGGFKGLLLGSVSNQCAHHAPCPLVIIRPDTVSEPSAEESR
jgi:nucleotide-binding universal stress UspA family protein